ncbi:hypothetical protein GS399_05020 [Pedobacter sp. HMF7647]|uniref:Uncharacterized protein n=1 Tax=Hufsiella arboris TaxID=2695275 RepID=A0A7K1Y6Y2_9SPHI|nr:hypothetical protein [Hufsiella arboris]MXV50325.1 hypothetical protein [Hufsiella arboris]
MSQVSLELEDLNPGESFLIPINVVLYFPREVQKRIAHPAKQVSNRSSLDPLGYTLDCDISSETSLSATSKLSILLGDLDVLKNRSQKVFWIGHGDEGVQLLEVKKDYPQKYGR